MEQDILLEFRSERMSLLKEIEEEFLPAYERFLMLNTSPQLRSRSLRERNIILQKREEILCDLLALDEILN